MAKTTIEEILLLSAEEIDNKLQGIIGRLQYLSEQKNAKKTLPYIEDNYLLHLQVYKTKVTPDKYAARLKEFAAFLYRGKT